MIVHWLHALHLMAAGDWCTWLHGRLFGCTSALPAGDPKEIDTGGFPVNSIPFGMHHLIRHGYECTGIRFAWICAPR